VLFCVPPAAKCFTMNQPEMCERFLSHFGVACEVVTRAPGRVNLIGEHTDYNDGFVLPIATEQETWVAGARRGDGFAQVYSAGLDDQQSWALDDWRAEEFPHWTSYVAGVASLLRQRGARLEGFDLLIQSNVLPGGGLSSSAALEVATALALSRIAGEPLEAAELVDLCRTAEHDFAQVPCGVMDQFTSVMAEAGHALLLDCRTRKHEQIPLELSEHLLVVVDSGVRHELAGGEYARRQQECRQAVEYFRQHDPQVTALRDVSVAMVRAHAAKMDPVIKARSMHVVSENERTLAAADALRVGDLRAFGRLMTKSHRSLREDYEVSCDELDRLVEIISDVSGVLGVRMTGGGFGGCVVALARTDSVPLIEHATRGEYDVARPQAARLVRTRPNRGASVELG
jgi:galactokinase